MTEQVPVLIVGGGASGLTLAMDLGFRGVPCRVIESRVGAAKNPRCNTTAARSMEHYRRLGVADRIRAAGLPADYPTTVVYRTRFIGEQITRLELPSSGVARSSTFDDPRWPTPEPQHRISQIFLEPILEEHAASFPGVTIERGTCLLGFEQDERTVRAIVQEASGQRRTIEAQYLVGCDGAHSTVRRQLGIRYEGINAVSQAVSTYIDSPELAALNVDPAWSAWSINPDGTSLFIAIDGGSRFLHHAFFAPEVDTSQIDPRELIAKTVGREIAYEELATVRWTGRALNAERYRVGRTMLVGDAAHIWVPMAGYGMNAGIQDATNLAWMLSAVHHGWAGAGLLDGYEAERRPLGFIASRAAAGIMTNILGHALRQQVELAGARGAQARARLGEAIQRGDGRQYHPVGLNFAYSYHESPLIIADGSEPPTFEVDRYEPSARPGSRLPHLRRADGTPIFDQLGPDFTLLRVGDAAPNGQGLVSASEHRGVPLRVLTLLEPAAAGLYGENCLVLVRPDQTVAFRSAQPIADPVAIIDRVRGAL